MRLSRPVRNAAQLQAACSLLEVLAALVAQHVQHGGRVLHLLLALLFLAVQHPQGVAVEAAPAGFAHAVQALAQVFLQHGMILRAAVGAADGVDVHGQISHAQAAEQPEGQQDQLRIRRGLLRAEALQAELVMLPQPAVCGFS